jgi:general L-amino acid transport system permease protein
MAQLLRDARVRSAVLQLGVVALAAWSLWWLVGNTATNLQRRSITVGFDFLDRAARFPISETILAYRPSDSFAWAFVVGLGNTLFLTAIIAAASTVLGLATALGRRSENPLASGVATVFVETMRNTPLVVQLLFWYAVVTMGLPPLRAALSPIDGVYLTDRGLFVPSLHVDGATGALWLVLALGVAVTLFAATLSRARYGLLAAVLAAAAAVATWYASGLSLRLVRPELGRFNYAGGMALTPEFVAMFAGLVLYSSAFVGEIIRGGIDAVGRGQWEAGRAIGLADSRTLRLVVLPQALRVIVPPLTSQYITILKNTTLALVVGYPDIAFVTSTTINQTGQAIEGILILMLVFVTISVAASAAMNLYNRRLMLVQR